MSIIVKFYTLLLIGFFQLASIFGQVVLHESQLPLNPDEFESLNTPYSTAVTFFYNLREENYDPESAAKSLAPEAQQEGDLSKLVVKLKQIFDGNGVYVKINDVPHDPNFIDSTNNSLPRYYFDVKKLPAVYLQKIGNQWKFSAFTVSQIDEMHKETYPFGTDRLLNILPQMGNQIYFGLHFWQLAGLFLLILLLFLSHKIITFIIDRGLLYFLVKFDYGYTGEKYLLPVARIVSVYFIVLILSLFIRLLQLPIELVSWGLLILNAAME